MLKLTYNAEPSYTTHTGNAIELETREDPTSTLQSNPAMIVCNEVIDHYTIGIHHFTK